MPRLSMLVAAFLLFVASARAEESGPLNQVQLLLGPTAPTNKLGYNGQDRLGGPGVALGARYCRRAGPIFDVGLEITAAGSSEHSSDMLVGNAVTKSKVGSLFVLLEGKIARQKGTLRPWVLAGFGIHSTTLKMDVTPNAGYSWTNTLTRETRTIIDSTKSAGALTLQAGVDAALSEHAMLGLAFAWYLAGKATYSVTPDGRASGFADASGPISYAGLQFNLGWRF
ncbi:MAG: outer membrane beta-barrel protein [Elusimicrobia bacterium]|nr:outer membrane beta-barrel protein [Elusimicrobiota bacterium]